MKMRHRKSDFNDEYKNKNQKYYFYREREIRRHGTFWKRERGALNYRRNLYWFEIKSPGNCPFFSVPGRFPRRIKRVMNTNRRYEFLQGLSLIRDNVILFLVRRGTSQNVTLFCTKRRRNGDEAKDDFGSDDFYRTQSVCLLSPGRCNRIPWGATYVDSASGEKRGCSTTGSVFNRLRAKVSANAAETICGSGRSGKVCGPGRVVSVARTYWHNTVAAAWRVAGQKIRRTMTSKIGFSVIVRRVLLSVVDADDRSTCLTV